MNYKQPVWLFFMVVWAMIFMPSPSLHAQENIDSLIASWNQLAADFLEVNQIDSACKYGNCVVDMMEQDLELNPERFNSAELNSLRKQKAEALSNLVSAYGYSDQIELAGSCYEAALSTYNDLGDQEGVFHLHIRMGRVNDLRSDYRAAIPYYHKAFSQAERIGDKTGMSLSCYHLGLNNRYLGNYSEGLKYHLKDLAIQEEMQNKQGIANAYVTVAAILKKLNDAEAALDKLHLAEYLYDEIHDTSGIAMVLNDLGTTFEMLGDTLNALTNHEKAAQLRGIIGEYDGLGASYSYIARIYLARGDHARALSYLKKADNAFHKGSNIQGIMTTQIEMASVYTNKGNYDSTLSWLAYAEISATEIMNYYGLVSIYSIRGETRLKQHLFKEAIAEFNTALRIALDQNYHQQIYLINSHLAELYKKMAEPEQAYDHLLEAFRYKDSIHANANLSAAVQMEMQYNYNKEKLKNVLLQEKKDALNEAALTEQETQKWLFFAGVLMFLMISLGLFSRLRYIRKSSKALLAQKEEADRHRLVAEAERERATQSEKVKQQFLANMSHEIRTPMNAIKGMTDILVRNEHFPTQDKYLKAISESSENLLIILNEILDLSKLEAGKIEFENIPFAPQKILHNVKNILRYKAEEKGLALSYNINDNVPQYVLGDPTRLNQILVNLGSNAIKFTDKGGVEISVDQVGTAGETATVGFTVKDTGIGIARDKINTIFEAFTQADADTTRKYGGTGLGLSICKRLVEMMGGSISVESEKNKGSEFQVLIPYQVALDEPAGKPENFDFQLKNLKILLVEDNEFNVMVARDELESSIEGVEIQVAENGKTAVEMVRSTSYDLILMDIQMPEMDGYEATQIIRKMESSKRQTPIMAMTANVMKAEVDRCFEAGMNAYISKPFDRNELFQNIDSLLASSLPEDP